MTLTPPLPQTPAAQQFVSGTPAPGSATATPAELPALGAAAVTAARDTKDTDLRSDTSAEADPLEPPADPPPVKGLGIPPLDTSKVGDFDEPEAPPPPPSDSIPNLLANLDGSEPHALDQRR